MKAKEIQELINFLADSGLEEVNIETENFKVSIKRSAEQHVVAAAAPAPIAAAPIATPASPAAVPAAQSTQSPESSASKDANLLEVKSPMIGTFYRSPNPESPVFVEVGSTIKAGDTVCIVEAMKLFNEIESEVSGKIVKVLVDNAQPVEYDQPLFLVDPS